MGNAKLDSLNLVASEAILRAEVLTDLGAPGASEAHLDVSMLEEKIAESTSASSSEGAIARQGAVGAAILAGHVKRAKQLVERFCTETDASDELRDELRDLLTRLKSPPAAEEHLEAEPSPVAVEKQDSAISGEPNEPPPPPVPPEVSSPSRWGFPPPPYESLHEILGDELGLAAWHMLEAAPPEIQALSWLMLRPPAPSDPAPSDPTLRSKPSEPVLTASAIARRLLLGEAVAATNFSVPPEPSTTVEGVDVTPSLQPGPPPPSRGERPGDRHSAFPAPPYELLQEVLGDEVGLAAGYLLEAAPPEIQVLGWLILRSPLTAVRGDAILTRRRLLGQRAFARRQLLVAAASAAYFSVAPEESTEDQGTIVVVPAETFAGEIVTNLQDGRLYVAAGLAEVIDRLMPDPTTSTRPRRRGQ